MTVKEYIDSLEKSTLKPVNPGDPSFAAAEYEKF